MYAFFGRLVVCCFVMMSAAAYAVEDEASAPPVEPSADVSVRPVFSAEESIPASSLPDPLSNKYFHAVPQWYVDFSGSWNAPVEASIRGAASTKTSFDSGEGFSAALGYKPPYARGFFSQTRFELEGAYRTSGVKNDFITPTTASSGSLHVWSAMVNAYFDLKNTSAFTPYVGGGLGMTSIAFKAPRLSINDSDTVPAYQLMAGVGYEPEALPRVGFHLGYRYLSTFSDPTYHTSTNTKVTSDYASHGVEGGIRLSF